MTDRYTRILQVSATPIRYRVFGTYNEIFAAAVAIAHNHSRSVNVGFEGGWSDDGFGDWGSVRPMTEDETLTITMRERTIELHPVTA